MRASRHLPAIAFASAIALAAIGLGLQLRRDRTSRSRIGDALREVEDFLRQTDTLRFRVSRSNLTDWMTASAVRRRVES